MAAASRHDCHDDMSICRQHSTTPLVTQLHLSTTELQPDCYQAALQGVSVMCALISLVDGWVHGCAHIHRPYRAALRVAVRQSEARDCRVNEL